MIIAGTAWRVGDNVAATALVAAEHDSAAMARDWDTCAAHLLENVDASIVREMRKGDVLVGGTNFGRGHAHYHFAAVHGIARAGFALTLAESFNPLFFRAAIDAGIVMHAMPGVQDAVGNRDDVRVDLSTGIVDNITRGQTFKLRAVPELVLEILEAGGSEPWSAQRAARQM